MQIDSLVADDNNQKRLCHQI